MALQKNIFGQKRGPAKAISGKKSGTAIAGPLTPALIFGTLFVAITLSLHMC